MITRNGLGQRAMGILDGAQQLSLSQPSNIGTVQMGQPLQVEPIGPAGSGGLPQRSVPVQMPAQPKMSPVPSLPATVTNELAVMKAADQMTKAPPEVKRDPTFGDRVKRFFGDEETMYRLAMAFNSLSGTPDKQLGQFLGEQIKDVRAQKQSNRTLEVLRQRNPEVAKMVEAGMPIKDAMALAMGGKAESTIGKLAGDLKAGRITQEQYDQEVARLAKAGSTTINMPGSDKIYDLSAQIIADQAESLPQILEQASNLEVLSRLGEITDQNVPLPSWARSVVPEGISSSLDAYGSILKSTAQSLYVKGTGPLTEQEFQILMERAGSISASPNARRIAQAGLRRAAEIATARGVAAQRYLRNPNAEGARDSYYAEIERLDSLPLLTDEQRTLLEALEKDSDVTVSSADQGFKVTSVRRKP